MASKDDKRNQKIIADYVATQNKSEAARMNNVSEATVRRILKMANVQDITKKIEQKRVENTQSTLEYMQTQHDTKKRIIDKLLNAIERKTKEDLDKLNIKDLATAYGIILDKELKLLELTKATENNANNGIITELIGALNNAKKSQ